MPTIRRERMQAMARDVWFLERELVSDGYDKALERLSAEVMLKINHYESGSSAWTWVIPEKWTRHEAYVERLNGERIVDARDHPLHCASYSCTFEGIVSREELFKHLHTHPRIRDAIPFAWKYYKNDWALCCTAEQKEAMRDEQYRVVIRTEHTPGHLKVGEYVVQGESAREFILCAHLCHPCMMNDDLSGVIVGLEVMRALREVSDLHYTYRLLLTPETIGSLAWLSRNEDKIPKIIGGMFLEMLGTDCPHSLQLSFGGSTILDQSVYQGLKEIDPEAWQGPFRRVIGNDERQFNAPGVRVPMLSLSRVWHPSTGKWPYPEYHTSKDTPESISWDRLEDSVETVLHLIRRIESDRYPVNLFKGEVFCSRYGLFTDFYQDPEGNIRLFDVMQLIDGTRTVSQIAEASSASFSTVLDLLKKMERQELIRFSDTPCDTTPRRI